MEIVFEGISFQRDKTDLDKFAMDFVHLLNEAKMKYVIVSGYVSILFGRSRLSEDIDIITENIDAERFSLLWEIAGGEFECLNTKNAKEAYEKYMVEHYAIRFSRKGRYIPNVELKFPSTEVEQWALENSKEVFADGIKFPISPIELQIAFKLFLGSEKDIEDAKYLYILFKEILDQELLQGFLKQLEQKDNFRRYIDEIS